MSVGERISALRKEQNISQVQLAEALDVTRQAVSKWETDQSSPDTLKLIQLADVLNTEVEYLATGRKPVYKSPPIVVNVVKKVDRIVEKEVEKPIIKHITRIRHVRNPVEYAALGVFSFIVGLLFGLII